MKVAISGNCQVGGVRRALVLLRPGDEFRIVSPENVDETADKAEARSVSDAAYMSTADLWIRMPHPSNNRLEAEYAHVPTLEIPPIVFSGFHPDLVYAKTLEGDYFRGVGLYHSAIALWAWKNDVGPDQAAHLFVPEIFERLGYYSHWSIAHSELQGAFEKSELPFSSFWPELKRHGVFMNSVNHPTAEALASLAKSVAVAMGSPTQVWSDPIERLLSDSLASTVWPVYPGVGESLGVAPSFRWRVNDQLFPDLRSYLRAVWREYERHDPRAVESVRLADADYHEVLSAALSVNGGV